MNRVSPPQRSFTSTSSGALDSLYSQAKYSSLRHSLLSRSHSPSEKIIEGFGELFRQISFSKIGTSAIQSRALGALIKGTYVFAIHGSTSACKDAWDNILKFQLDNRYRPCNFIEIMPRLQEK